MRQQFNPSIGIGISGGNGNVSSPPSAQPQAQMGSSQSEFQPLASRNHGAQFNRASSVSSNGNHQHHHHQNHSQQQLILNSISSPICAPSTGLSVISINPHQSILAPSQSFRAIKNLVHHHPTMPSHRSPIELRSLAGIRAQTWTGSLKSWMQLLMNC